MARCPELTGPVPSMLPDGWVAPALTVSPIHPLRLTSSHPVPGQACLRPPEVRQPPLRDPFHHCLSPVPHGGAFGHGKVPFARPHSEEPEARSLEEASWHAPEDTSSSMRTAYDGLVYACVHGGVPGSTAELGPFSLECIRPVGPRSSRARSAHTARSEG